MNRIQKTIYLGASNQCPFCHTNDINGGEQEYESGTISQRVACVKCGARWWDVYTLTDVEVINRPSKKVEIKNVERPTADDMDRLVVVLEELEALRLRQYQNISGGFAVAKFDEFDGESFLVSVSHGTQNEEGKNETVERYSVHRETFDCVLI